MTGPPAASGPRELPAAAQTRRALRLAIPTLMTTQILGWGSSFHVAAALHGRLAAGIGLPGEIVFGGLTIMLIVAAFLAPWAGRVLERDGARRWMVIGSGLFACALLILSMADGLLLFVLAWLVFGAAMPFALNQGSSVAIVQIAPDRARKALALLLLVAGLSATIMWPLLISLDAAVGWRTTLIVCAAANLLICAPLHALGLPRPGLPPPARDLPPVARDAVPAPHRKAVPEAFALLALSSSISGVLTWGLPLHMLAMLSDLGHDERTAVIIGSLLGPGQMLARAFDMLGGHKIDILRVGAAASAIMPAALVCLLLWGRSDAGALLFVFCYAVSAGMLSIVRAITPLRLFGPKDYAVVLGRLGVPQNIAFASAPLGFAVVRERWGADALASVSLVLAIICLWASAVLAIRTLRAERRASA